MYNSLHYPQKAYLRATVTFVDKFRNIPIAVSRHCLFSDAIVTVVLTGCFVPTIACDSGNTLDGCSGAGTNFVFSVGVFRCGWVSRK